MILWTVTIALNVALALLLLLRGHYKRYPILLHSLIFEIFAAGILHWIYATYGTYSSLYADAFHVKKMITILFSFGIIWEGIRWNNRCLRLPQELYLLSLLIAFVAEKAQFFTVFQSIHDMLRWSNLAILVWWLNCFKGDERDERRKFRSSP